MGLLALFFDTVSKKLVSGIDDPTTYAFAPYRQGDTPTFDITMLNRIKGTYPFFARKSFGGWTATMAIGSVGASLTSGVSAGLSSDNFTFQNIPLPLNTAGINALTDGQGGIYTELQFTEVATGNYFGRRFDCSVEKAVLVPGAVITPAGDRALLLSEAQNGYVKRRGDAGASIELVSPDGTKTALIYVDNDGALHGLT